MAHERIPVTGGCLCGAVRYEVSEPPTAGSYCHCAMCRKQSGSLSGAAMEFSWAAFRFTKGELKYYQSSAGAKRGFCGNCGSRMAFVSEGDPKVWVSVGSLDHPEDWPMTKGASWGRSQHIYVGSKVVWYAIGDGLPQQATE
ncbi:MAG: GFA family protein [Dongiaceae bacterium]